MRNKRKYVKKFVEDCIDENLELKRKYWNIVIWECRKVIWVYWYIKVDEYKLRLLKFYDMFKFFISNKSKELVVIYFKIESDIVVKD